MTLNEIIENAIKEDIGNGDYTSLACIPGQLNGEAQLLVKESGIIAGINVAEAVLKTVNSKLQINLMKKDGDTVERGDVVFTVKGNVRSLLQAERIVLNFMQRMSGIATKTNQFVKLLEGSTAKLLDTRKTTPGLRFLEKEAVRIGGGYNHRMGLYDMIMIKDNHIDFAGGVEKAIKAVNSYLKEKKLKLKIEIEARNINEVMDVIRVGGVDIIMLDNFTKRELKYAIKIIDRKILTEVSGGINENNIDDYARIGIDYISVGALTNNVKALDLSFKAKDIIIS
ncbi:MAG: carboxylating nicotinate-nucleotide diphosphorylase [Bacteroidales bacterium]|nr:carboxylating nicotinate-nucleotide diphosphorylase [Bacteroidales bacterium]